MVEALCCHASVKGGAHTCFVETHTQMYFDSKVCLVALEKDQFFSSKVVRHEGQCSHQNLQAKGHKYYLMTTPIILNVVIVTNQHLLQVYHCQQSILVELNVH